jgi:hypothetical protein
MTNRTGFHYYDDEDHYTAADLATWLPRLEALGAGWLVLRGSLARLVPEPFIKGLLDAGIEPVIRIAGHPIHRHSADDLNQTFTAYGRWGVRYVTLYEDANERASWQPGDWALPGLVERFVDCLLPALSAMSAAGLTPVIPPLAAGGDYWDTAFLDSLLASMVQRGYGDALAEMAVGVYLFTGNRPLDWGSGGPDTWPEAQPYVSPPGVQDQRGFHRFEWIDAVVQRHVGCSLDQIVLAGGATPGAADLPDQPPVDLETHAALNLEIARRMDAAEPDAVPAYVKNMAFWLLAADAESAAADHAWWLPGDEGVLPAADRLVLRDLDSLPKDVLDGGPGTSWPAPAEKPLAHYLLLPAFEWGISDWYWEAVRDFVQAFRPVCGFSTQEAALAQRVTIVGDARGVPARVAADLRAAGCEVRRAAPDEGQTIEDALQVLIEEEKTGEPEAVYT